MSKSHFSKSFEVTRIKTDRLIADDKLPVECIDGTDYINVTDRNIIMDALNSGEGSGSWQRNSVIKPYKFKNEADRKFEEDYLESMK